MVHPISPLAHFGLGTGIRARGQKGTQHASGSVDGCPLLHRDGAPHLSTNLFRPLFSKHKAVPSKNWALSSLHHGKPSEMSSPLVGHYTLHSSLNL